MEEFRAGRFFRREHELHQSAVGRVLWRQVRSGYNRPAMDSTPPGPYETSYNVQRGYSSLENLKT